LTFSANTRQHGSATVIDLKGRLTLMEGEALHDLCLDLIRDGRKLIILNFRKVDYLDSSGIGQIVRSLFAARRHSADICAVDLSTRSREILRLANLHTVMGDFPDESSAIEALSAS
jgi:anti-sigma B factor antagonist